MFMRNEVMISRKIRAKEKVITDERTWGHN